MSEFSIQRYNSISQFPEKIIQPSAWTEHIPFAYFLAEILAPETIVELGVHNGSSYSAFCQASKNLKNKTKCYGIDTWKGEKHAGFYEENIYQELYQYHKEIFSEYSTLLRMTFDEALSNFPDKSVGLLHIDGLHTYDAVKHDFDTWLPKVQNGGVILFHDTQEKQTDFGVWKLWEEISPKYKSYEFKHCHGLGVLLIGSNPVFESFLEEINKNTSLQYLFFSLGKTITDKIEKANQFAYHVSEWNRERTELESNIKNLHKDNAVLHNNNEALHSTIADLHKELVSLHAKAESMRLKNRFKKLFRF